MSQQLTLDTVKPEGVEYLQAVRITRDPRTWPPESTPVLFWFKPGWFMGYRHGLSVDFEDRVTWIKEIGEGYPTYWMGLPTIERGYKC
jgi:hypothetical protein